MDASRLTYPDPKSARVRSESESNGTGSTVSLIHQRSFSYRADTPMSYNSTTLKSNYRELFPALSPGHVLGLRVDRLVVRGSDNGQPLHLEIGKDYSIQEVPGPRRYAEHNVRMHPGACDEDTIISYQGVVHLRIYGVITLRLIDIPGRESFEKRRTADGSSKISASSLPVRGYTRELVNPEDIQRESDRIAKVLADVKATFPRPMPMLDSLYPRYGLRTPQRMPRSARRVECPTAPGHRPRSQSLNYGFASPDSRDSGSPLDTNDDLVTRSMEPNYCSSYRSFGTRNVSTQHHVPRISTDCTSK